MYRAFAFSSYSNLIISLCALLDGQGAATDTMRTSPALASVYMTSSLRPSSASSVCTRLFGLECIGGAAVEDVANVRHGDAPFVHPPVAVGSRSNLHGTMI